MVDPALMRGDGWVRCCICGELHVAPYPHLLQEWDRASGTMQYWDVCFGDCARAAGLLDDE